MFNCLFVDVAVVGFARLKNFFIFYVEAKNLKAVTSRVYHASEMWAQTEQETPEMLQDKIN